MIAHRMLSLSDVQLGIVLDHAKMIRPEYRERYLNAVADQLLPLETLDDAAVSNAALGVIGKMNGWLR